MARTAYYDDNRNRRYPFISTDSVEQTAGVAIPNSVLLDAGFNLGAYSGFDPAVHSVWLANLHDGGANLVFQCQTDAPSLVGKTLQFSLPKSGAKESNIVFADCNGLEVGGNADNCTDQLLWYGFLVVGDVSAAASWLESHSDSLSQTHHTFEPALVQDCGRSYVRSVSLANRQRTRVTDTPGAVKPYIVAARCLQGPIKFREGHNCQIGYSTSGNGLVFSAVNGAGAGEACQEVRQFPAETSPDGGQLLSGGPTCGSTIRFVNGVPGPELRLVAGPGVTIRRDDILTNKLYISAVVSMVQGASVGVLP